MEKLNISHLVPNFILADRNGYALAKAIEAAMQLYFDLIQEGIATAFDPDKMPEWRLDELAKDENLLWYDYSAPVEVKREIIKSARPVYSMLGTVAGAERAAQSYAADARIEEWFEYGGDPAHFRIRSGSFEAAENASGMVKSVNDVKRLSSVLDAICIDHPTQETRLWAGLALFTGGRVQYGVISNENADSLYPLALTDETNVLLTDENGFCLLDEGG